MTIDYIFQTARARGKAHNCLYAGAVTPQEAFAVLQDNAAVLIDVRSEAELRLVGRIPGALHIEWAFYPHMTPNPDFANALKAAQTHYSWAYTQPLFFICRSGGRSHSAATLAADLDFSAAFNVLEGFEGVANDKQQRTLINGWRHAGLPWIHS